MDFFKAAFSEPSPSPSPPSSPTSSNSRNSPPPASSWHFGSALFKTLASKSETLLDNYVKDFHEFSSGLRKETSVIREAASRAVQDLPGRLESGAAIAQESLEAVGQAIDDVGITVSEIIRKDLNFTNLRLDESGGSGDDSGSDLNSSRNVKPYSRLEAMIREVQCDVRTYCDEVEESAYSEWKTGFRVEEKREEIERLMEENDVIKGIYNEVVPRRVGEELFWCRYFYRVDRTIKAEEARASIVKRAIAREEEEDLSWDVEDDSDEEKAGGVSVGDFSKNDVWGEGKGVEDSQVGSGKKEVKERDVEDATVLGTKGDDVLVDEENLEGRLIGNEKEGSDGKIESDISVISSQRSSHAEDDIGWDQIEDVRSGDERQVGERGSMSPLSGIRKQLNTPEDDEILTWDIEDDA